MRKPTPDELRLLYATAASDSLGDPSWVAEVRVESMDDGGMGSLRLVVADDQPPDLSSVSIASDVRFKDEDGVDVLVTLYVTPDGVPREMDIWKTNFAPVVAVPSVLPKATRRIT